MYPPIFETCDAVPAVELELGSSPIRLYPFGEAPDDVTLPYAVWQTVGGQPENYLNNNPDIDGYTLQVDTYATTGTAARDAAEALRDAIQSTAHITSWNGEDRDPDTKYYRYSFQVDWLTARA